MSETLRGTRKAGRARRSRSMPGTAQQHQDELERYYELRDTLNDQISTQRSETVALSGEVKNVHSQLSTIFTKLDMLGSRMEASQKTNWPVIGLLVTIILAIIPGGWFVVTNAVSNAILPVQALVGQVQQADAERDRKIYDLSTVNTAQSREIGNISQGVSVLEENQKRVLTEVANLTSESGKQDNRGAQSEGDRSQLNNRLRTLETAVSTGTSDRRSAFAEMGARLLEVEQQFHHVSDVENIRWSVQQAFNALEFEKTHPGEHFPQNGFFPQASFQTSPPGLTGSK